MKRLILALFVMLSLPAFGQFLGYNGQCSKGGQDVVVQGMVSSGTKPIGGGPTAPHTGVIASYPSCTVNVYLTGTVTHASIFSDPGGITPLSNSFTANTDGSFLFFSAGGVGYDITMSGGGMPSTVTLTDVVLGGSGGGGGTITGISTPAAGGLIGGAGSGIVTLSLTNACTSNQVLQWDGSSWICASISPPVGVTLKTNGILNGSQTILDLFAGSNLTITDNGAGRDTFNVTGVLTGATPLEGLEQTGSTIGLLSTCSVGQNLSFDGTHWNCATSGSGTVTTVGLSTTANWFTVGNSPITTAGTITFNPTSGMTANRFVATPNGSTGAVALRAIVAADLPATITSNTNGNAATATAAAALGTECPVGQAARGVDTSWNARDCFAGGGSGSVTSVGLVGTANQLTVTGTSPITTSGSWILSIPNPFNVPGAANVAGAFSVGTAPTVCGTAADCIGVAEGSTAGLAPVAGQDALAFDSTAHQIYVTLNGGTKFVSAMNYPVQGSDTNVLSSGTVAGTGAILCTDANGGATTSGCPAGSGTVTSVATSGGLTGGTITTTGTISIANNGVTATQLAAQYSKLRCETGLGDGLNAVPAGTYLQSMCYNDSGVTWTITGIKCYTDTGTSTLNAVGNTLGALLTGAVTCTNAWAAGSQSANVLLTSGDYIKFTFVADGTAKQTTWVVSMTQ